MPQSLSPIWLDLLIAVLVFLQQAMQHLSTHVLHHIFRRIRPGSQPESTGEVLLKAPLRTMGHDIVRYTGYFVMHIASLVPVYWAYSFTYPSHRSPLSLAVCIPSDQQIACKIDFAKITFVNSEKAPVEVECCCHQTGNRILQEKLKSKGSITGKVGIDVPFQYVVRTMDPPGMRTRL